MVTKHPTSFYTVCIVSDMRFGDKRSSFSLLFFSLQSSILNKANGTSRSNYSILPNKQINATSIAVSSSLNLGPIHK